MSEKEKGPNIAQRFVGFLKDVRGELKKVVWPTRTQLLNNTVVVIVAVIIVGALISALDFGFAHGIKYLSKEAGTATKQQTTPDTQSQSQQVDDETLKQIQEQMQQNAAEGTEGTAAPENTGEAAETPAGDAANE